MTATENHFTTHEIVTFTDAPGFGSWLMKRRHADGGLERVFWVRITAADGLVRVSGDFDPTVFAHGPLDPAACVRWVGGMLTSDGDVSAYGVEKAGIGSGGSAILSRWGTEWAREDIEVMIDEALADADEDDERASEVRALRAGLEKLEVVDSDSEFGCMLVHREIMRVDDDAWEWVGSIGRRLHPKVTMAVQACARLIELLEVEEPVIQPGSGASPTP